MAQKVRKRHKSRENQKKADKKWLKSEKVRTVGCVPGLHLWLFRSQSRRTRSNPPWRIRHFSTRIQPFPNKNSFFVDGKLIISPWKLIISPWKLIISPWKLIISPWKLIISPWKLIISPWKTALFQSNSFTFSTKSIMFIRSTNLKVILLPRHNLRRDDRWDVISIENSWFVMQSSSFD